MTDTTETLVSIHVITYNSSKTIVETLDSIYNQTYKNIELVISDDCSTDTTVDICREWISRNGGRFARTEIIKASTNTGIAANCNRAMDACQADWVKPLAGDDILLPRCIDAYMQYVSYHENTACLFSRVQCFSALNGKKVNNYDAFDYRFFSLPREKQLDHLIYGWNCIPAATAFMNLAFLRKNGIRYDERIPMLEDFPMWINILNSGHQLEFLDQKLVCYRIYNGISTTTANPAFYYSGKLFVLLYQYPEWAKRDPIDAHKRLRAAMGEGQQRIGVRERRNMRVGNLILSPIYWIKKNVMHLQRRD
jgi:alpha-1,3-rhamnosyltransferase